MFAQGKKLGTRKKKYFEVSLSKILDILPKLKDRTTQIKLNSGGCANFKQNSKAVPTLSLKGIVSRVVLMLILRIGTT